METQLKESAEKKVKLHHQILLVDKPAARLTDKSFLKQD